MACFCHCQHLACTVLFGLFDRCSPIQADINADNFRGNTALHFAQAYGFYELFDYLLEKGGDDTLLNEEGLHCYQGVGKEMRQKLYK